MFPLSGGIPTERSKLLHMRGPAIILVSLCLWVSMSLSGCRSTAPVDPGGTVGPTPSIESSTATPSSDASPSPDGEASAQSASERQVRVQGSTITTRKGQPWKLEAEEVDWLDSSKAADARNVTWYLLDPDGEPFVKVEALQAEVDVDAELVTFVGEVNASRLDSDEELTVQRLLFDGQARQFFGSEGVVWNRPGYELRGDTLTASAQLDKVQLKGNVEGRFVGLPSRVGIKPGAEDT